jgi:hypothetical protein
MNNLNFRARLLKRSFKNCFGKIFRKSRSAKNTKIHSGSVLDHLYLLDHDENLEL